MVSESNYQRLIGVDSPKVRRGKVEVIREKISKLQLASMAENWQPWNHFGEKLREGTGKTPLNMYGPFNGWLLSKKRRIRENSSTFRRLEIQLSRLLWRLGVR